VSSDRIDHRRRRAALWWLFLYAALVYATSPWTPALAEAFGVLTWGRGMLAVGPLVVAAVLVIVGIGRARDRGPRAIVPWLIILGLYGVVWQVVVQQPIEVVHLMQYGVMSVLALRALRWWVPRRLAYAGSAVFTVAASWGNELLQSVLPSRVYDLRDVALDGLAAALGLTIAWQLERRGAAGSNGSRTRVREASAKLTAAV
jgi:hypothetical protein